MASSSAANLLFFLVLCFLEGDGKGNISDEGDTSRHYFLYSVNPGEGFNLRRDVHMRAASLVQTLRQQQHSVDGAAAEDWVLVLPPWPHLYHWKSRNVQQTNVKWDAFFHLPSLNEFVPTIEFDEYVARKGMKFEEVLWLQHFSKWDEWEETLETAPCSRHTPYIQTDTGAWRGSVFGRQETIEAESFRCVSVMGFTKTLIPEMAGKKSVFVEHLEVVMHSVFGGLQYWKSRASMVYAKHLREAGNEFMRSSLDYDPGLGNGRSRPRDGGGAYLAVHLRREDYKKARPKDIPSLEGAGKQIHAVKKLQGLEKVFLSTDAPIHEREVLADLVGGVVWYTPTESDLHRYGDGGVAIIDQWIASHSKFFIGSHESTFSFRIREDRQLMRFSRESTFNQLCGSKDNDSDHTSCAPPTYWEMPREMTLERDEGATRTEL